VKCEQKWCVEGVHARESGKFGHTVSDVSDIDAATTDVGSTRASSNGCARGQIEDDDCQLMAAHLAGDPDAFGQLMAAHLPRMLAVARRRTRNADEAADVVQEATLKALRGAAGFRGESSVATWLHRIVVNTCLDRLKRARVPCVPWEIAFRFHADPQDPRNDIGLTDLRMTLEQALRQLPWEQRVVLVLVHLEGLSLVEVADRLACPVGTVKSRCSRGRAALADRLGGSWRTD
jgi:RNA polymerase sigma-70 factor, ECF subfamily